MSLTGGIQLAPLMVDIKADLTGFKSDMKSASTYGVAEAEKLSTKLSGITKVGEKFSSLGGKMTMGVTVPLTGIAIAAGKVGMDFEAQMSRVQAISGATGKEFNKLNKQAIDLGSSTAFSATEAAQGMENLASAGFNVNEIMEAMPGMMDLAASSGEDLASSADIAASTLRGFGLEASQSAHVADVLAKNASATNAAVSDTGEAMKYIAPVAKAMGLSLEETTAAIGEMANAGIKGSEAGTALRGALTRLVNPSDEASIAMEKLKFSAFDAQGNMLPLNQIVGNLKTSMAGLTTEQKQQAIATIFGQEAMSGMLTLIDAGPESLTNLTNELKNSDGAAKDMAKTMQDNAKSGVEQMMGSLETAAIKIEKSVAPTITEVANFVGDLADKFSNLSEDQQENILKWTAIALAAGPVLKIFGGGISTVATLGKGILSLSNVIKGTTVATETLAGASTVAAGASGMGGMFTTMGSALLTCAPLAAGLAVVAGAVYVMHENSDYLNKSLLTTTEDLSIVEKGWNVMHGNVIKSKEEMEKLGLIYHDWSNKISPDVVSSIDKTADAWRKVNFQIDYLKTNNIALSSDTVAQLKNQTDSICQSIIQEIKDNQSESTKALSEYFNIDQNLNSYETTVLSFFDSNGQKQTALVQEYQNKINAIYKKAEEEHRGIAESEYVAIEEYQKKINQAKIDAISTTNEEYQELQANFNVKMKNLDLQGASELMQEKAQKRNEDISSTSEYYDTKIELLSMNLGSMNTQQRIAAEEEIRQLQGEKDKKLGVINDTYNGYLKTIEEKYPEIYSRIDVEEGKILSVEEQNDRKRVADSLTNFYDLGEITKSGMQRIYNTQSHAYEDIYVMVDDKTGKIVGTWNKSRDEITGNNEAIRNELSKTASQYSNLTESQKNNILNMINSNDNYSANTKNTALQVISALQGTGTSVNGLYTEVVNCNGTPVQVQVNKDGTIANLDEIINKVNSIPKVRYTTVFVQYSDGNGGSFSASKYHSDGRGGYIIPGYNYNGLENVPYDGYIARLHKGERVLTAEENKNYNTNNTSTTVNFNGNYNFNDKNDIDYFLNQAALKLKEAR